MELPPLIPCVRWFFSVLPHYFTVYIVFRVALPRHSLGFYGELSFGFPIGAAVLRPNILLSTPPSKNPRESTSMVSPAMPKIICVWQACDGLSTLSSLYSNLVLHCISRCIVRLHVIFCIQVIFWMYLKLSLHTVLPMKTVYRHNMMCRQMHRLTHISKVQGRMSFHHTAKFQYFNGSWFLIFLELHLSGVGMSSSAWIPSSMESGLINAISLGLTGSCCFDGELGMPSS